MRGGREQESNLPGTAWQPQPGLKSGRPTGAGSPPPASIRQSAELGNESGFVPRFQASAIQYQTLRRNPADDRAWQPAQT